MKQKANVFYDLLEQFEKPHCALCRVALRAINRFMDGLLYESVNDGRLREVLKSAHGFCPTHSATLAARHDALGTSILYRSLLNHLRAALAIEESGATANPSGLMRRLLGSDPSSESMPLSPQLPCPACARRHEAVGRALQMMNKHSADEALLEALGKSDGLCLPHLRTALGALQGPARQLLAARQQEVWEALSDELAEAIRKHDARFQGEEWGAEADSWRRAIMATVGQPGVF